jgi:hypothetical protein
MGQNGRMDSALKVVQTIRIAMLASIVLYVFVGELAARPRMNSPSVLIFYALTFVSITMVGIITVIRRTLTFPAQTTLAAQAADAAALNRWRGGYIASYAIAEAIALYGLVLRFLGFTLSQVAPFYIAAFMLLLLLTANRPSAELS